MVDAIPVADQVSLVMVVDLVAADAALVHVAESFVACSADLAAASAADQAADATWVASVTQQVADVVVTAVGS